MLRDVLKNLTSDSVALAGAGLGAGLGPTLGAGLGTGSAGAGGAAAAGPLQRALHYGLRPPQVWVTVGAQNRGAPSASAAHASGASHPSHPDKGQLEGEETPFLLEKTGLRSSLLKPLSLRAPLKFTGAELGTQHLYGGGPQP